jgi:hypothetical protein
MRTSVKRCRVVALSAVLSGMAAAAAIAQDNVIDGWTDNLLSLSRLFIWGASALGIAYAASSILKAYRSHDDSTRVDHMLAALWAGMFTMIGVLAGWMSNLLFPD